jgi:hypothetical protein
MNEQNELEKALLELNQVLGAVQRKLDDTNANVAAMNFAALSLMHTIEEKFNLKP